MSEATIGRSWVRLVELDRARLSLPWFGALLLGLTMLVAAFFLYRLFDYRIFFDASHRLLTGSGLYPSQTQLLQRTRDYYVYPPLVALIDVPLAQLPFAVAGPLYAFGAIAALVAALRVCGVTDRRCYIVLLLTVPVLQSVGLGTVEPFLVLALALAWRYRDRNWLGSAPLGLAIAAKLFLWPVLLWLLLTGRIRRTAETVAATGAAVLLPWALLGFHELTWYPTVLRLLVKTEQTTSWALPSIGVSITIVASTVAIYAASRSTTDGDRRAFSLSVVACLLVSPLVWLHYYVILIVPISVASRRFSALWVVPALAFWPFTDSHDNLAVKAWGLAVLAAVTVLTLRRRNRASDAPFGVANRAGNDTKPRT
jgi:hypothetical protein